ncbi:MAG: cytochrome c [Rhodocyclaceae bacterium]|nr:cytochrome c [Rhodocyclaceae bacterium]
MRSGRAVSSLLPLALVAACCWAAAGTARAAGEEAQRLAAEIAIMAGDARRLVQDPVRPLERTGLERRLAGALASLPLTLRRAGGDPSPVPKLRQLVGRHDWPALLAQLNDLKRRHPFDAGRLLRAAASHDDIALGASIHRSTCAGCHDSPGAEDQSLPAKNLAAQMQSMPPEEFAARLWLGVRGDSGTALANPFSEAELAALVAWYRQPR